MLSESGELTYSVDETTDSVVDEATHRATGVVASGRSTVRPTVIVPDRVAAVVEKIADVVTGPAALARSRTQHSCVRPHRVVCR